MNMSSCALTWHPPPLQRASQTSHLAASLTRGNLTASVWRTVKGENKGSEGVADVWHGECTKNLKLLNNHSGDLS